MDSASTPNYGPAAVNRWHIAQVPLRWSDTDANGHVNNVAFLRCLQEARVELLLSGPTDLDAGHGVVIASHELQYEAELVYRNEPVQVNMWVSDLRPSRFTFGYEVIDPPSVGSNRYLVATSVIVPYDVEAARPRRMAEPELIALRDIVRLDGPKPELRRPTSALTEGLATMRVPIYQRFDDLDTYRHVNNVTTLVYLEEAETRVFLGCRKPQQTDVVAHQTITYLAPMPLLRAPAEIELAVSYVGASSYGFTWTLRADDVEYARGTLACVAWDAAAKARRPLSPSERRRLGAL